jgi:hypothetical protein
MANEKQQSFAREQFLYRKILIFGEEGEIRTHGAVTRTTVFEF